MLIYELLFIFIYYIVTGILLYCIYQSKSFVNTASLVIALLLLLFLLDKIFYLFPIVAILPVLVEVNNGRKFGYFLIFAFIFIYTAVGYIALYCVLFLGLTIALASFIYEPPTPKPETEKLVEAEKAVSDFGYIDGVYNTYVDPFMQSFQTELTRSQSCGFDQEYLDKLIR
jgi:hypothetical protein